MDDIIRTTQGIVQSDAVKEAGEGLFKNVLSVLMKDPAAALELLKKSKGLISSIRDEIFFECFETYIFHSYELDRNAYQFEKKEIQSLSVALAEASPNAEADYAGDSDKLTYYAKRIVKLIDDCGTTQKAYYLACLTRAVIRRVISTPQFFTLSRCIRTLTEEDLVFQRKLFPGKKNILMILGHWDY